MMRTGRSCRARAHSSVLTQAQGWCFQLLWGAGRVFKKFTINRSLCSSVGLRGTGLGAAFKIQLFSGQGTLSTIQKEQFSTRQK